MKHADHRTRFEADAAELFQLAYVQLRAIAAQRLARERRNHTVQPTALVHEAWLRLVGRDEASFSTRSRFLAAASQAMRRVLVEHARSRAARRRNGGGQRVTLEPFAVRGPGVDVLDVDTAMQQLAAAHPRAAQVAELRWFGGSSMEEAATVLRLTPRQVKRDSELARAWLQRALRDYGSRQGRSHPAASGEDRPEHLLDDAALDE